MSKTFRIISLSVFFSILFLSLSSFLGREQESYFTPGNISSPFSNKESQWVDSLMESLSLEQKIAQLFMYAVYSNKNQAYNQSMLDLVEKYQIGGVIFMQGGPERQVDLNNRLQSKSNIPLMVGFDGEWGLSMRLDSVLPYPKSMAIGSIQDEQLVFDFGVEMGRQCRRLGIHVNFAPVLDINSNPNNPIINIRSFGEDKFNVARKGLSVTMGMQSQHVLAVGKHFPGHGDTKSDSHYTLPVITHSRDRLDSIEFYPFKTLINNGLGGIMIAHMAMPGIVADSGVPSSLSKEIVTDILKKDLGFEGLIFTDALNMKGVTRDYEHGQIEVKALEAGNDILLFPVDIEAAMNKILLAIDEGVLSKELVEERCRKVLLAKEWMGLSGIQAIDSKELYEDLHMASAEKLNEDLIQSSITVVDGANNIPIMDLANKTIASVSIGDELTVFDSTLCYYKAVDNFILPLTSTEEYFVRLKDSLLNYDLVIISQFQKSSSPRRNYGISGQEIDWVEQLLEQANCILTLFGNPYILDLYKSIDQNTSVVVCYENKWLTKFIAAQSIFGGRSYSGKLPVSCGPIFSVGMGEMLDQPIRLGYTKPSAFELEAGAFYRIDSLANYAIESGATPGCQILYAKDGKIVYNKTFGHHTYKNQRKVALQDLYDIASVTKVVGSTISLMKLYEMGEIEPSDKMSKHLKQFKKTDKKNVRINEILSHQSGFHSWIPFYRATLTEEGDRRPELYSSEPDAEFGLKVMEDLYLRNDYRDSIFQTILDTPMYKKKKYRYSDLGYYWMPSLIELKSGKGYEEFLSEIYFESLGMDRTLFNPLQNFTYPEIVPSENDKDFRKSVVHGFVNDQGAAMLGGVSGHAGLFSTSNDLAKLSQMLLNGGVYGGERYLDEKTIEVFNKSYFKRKGNRRGLGFDKPALKVEDPGPTCKSASSASFGHSGFTGAYFWVDPENQSIYVFLSNRTFPDQDNTKLAKEDIRTNIHQFFYDAFGE